MTDFSNLTALSITGKTADFTFYQLEGQPILAVRPATQDNPAYTNAALKANGAQITRGVKAKIDSEFMDRAREQDRALYAAHVVAGWTGVRDAGGKAVAFSDANCRAFLQALPIYLFDELRTFCGNPANFTDTDVDADIVAKN